MCLPCSQVANNTNLTNQGDRTEPAAPIRSVHLPWDNFLGLQENIGHRLQARIRYSDRYTRTACCSLVGIVLSVASLRSLLNNNYFLYPEKITNLAGSSNWLPRIWTIMLRFIVKTVKDIFPIYTTGLYLYFSRRPLSKGDINTSSPEKSTRIENAVNI